MSCSLHWRTCRCIDNFTKVVLYSIVSILNFLLDDRLLKVMRKVSLPQSRHKAHTDGEQSMTHMCFGSALGLTFILAVAFLLVVVIAQRLFNPRKLIGFAKGCTLFCYTIAIDIVTQ